MELFEINPFVRFADKRTYLPLYNDFVMAYDYRLFYVNSGALEIVFEDSLSRLSENDIAIVPPATKYMIRKLAPSEYIVLNFDMDFTNSHHIESSHIRSVEEFDEKNILSVNLYNEEPLLLSANDSARKKLEEICTEYAEKSYYHNEKNSTLLKSIIVESIIFTTLDRTPKIVKEVKKYIDENFHRSITNGELGDKFLYHPNHLNRLFKTHTKMSIHEFIIDLRLTKAVDMINNTDLSINRISEMCGFSSGAYFIKKFKEKYRLSPFKFRNQKFNKI